MKKSTIKVSPISPTTGTIANIDYDDFVMPLNPATEVTVQIKNSNTFTWPPDPSFPDNISRSGAKVGEITFYKNLVLIWNGKKWETLASVAMLEEMFRSFAEKTISNQQDISKNARFIEEEKTITLEEAAKMFIENLQKQFKTENK